MLAHIHLQSSRADQGGWNFRGDSPTLMLRCDSRSLVSTLESPAGVQRRWADPLEALHWMSTCFGDTADARWVGYLSYNLGALLEPHAPRARDDLHLPLFVFSLHERWTDARLDAIEHRTSAAPLTSTLPREIYLERVGRVIEYIRAGDVFQINLAQRFSTGLRLQPWLIWKNLREQTPAAYGGYLDYGDHALVCNSPELFLHVNADRRIITRPIKGTRPRMAGMDIQLRESIKDQAELNMIVDLERNDLGRVCEIGSVRVTQPRVIEEHPTVYHGVSTIEGMLRSGVTFVDLLRAAFPGGSITGAPKIRAMQIIDELEPVRRGPYCGAIGYLAANGSMQFNIAIRTMIIEGGLVHIPVGGGIVADSDPQAEYTETLVKARAMFNALGVNDECRMMNEE